MTATLKHRGPDDEGFVFDGPIGIGMRRLRVIDLATGAQPIHDPNRDVWVVLNGEIYNYREIRARLERKGARFSTRSDTEVLAHLYREAGDSLVDHLNGMFAFALWDARKRRLLIARDRIGIKPLYYYWDGKRLVFGSEIKALLQAGIPREIDPAGLAAYFTHNYIPAPLSIFRRVRKLPPAHRLVFERGNLRIERYWEIPRWHDSPGAARDPASWEEELREQFHRSIRRHLIADVPLGIFLSGGIDSSAITELACEEAAGRVRTFTIGFEEKSFDESARAREVARRLGTEHCEAVVKLEPETALSEIGAVFDEPFADASAIPYSLLCKLARSEVTVALGGDGGDELFGGYVTYNAHRLLEWTRAFPGPAAAHWLGRMAGWIPASDRKISAAYRAQQFVRGLGLCDERAYLAWRTIFFAEELGRLCPDLGAPLADFPYAPFLEAYSECRSPSALGRLLHMDLCTYLPDDILVKADRVSMAHSLEARVPFLDHEFVEFAARVPPSLKIRGFRKKALLKDAFRGRLPKAALRGPKRGFNVPVASWLRRELLPLAREMLSPASLRRVGLFDERYVQALLDEHLERKRDRSRNLWGLLAFLAWHERYAPPPRPSRRDEREAAVAAGRDATAVSP